ncbi:sulfurtransferase [Arthrobacter sp. Leaf69]|uniref:sulfurtransferase n=1 Tax=Arthrobacter sp. Leaf69 TaxID=1736232 RepID=UPI0006F74960|nr:sulfurtransferase [Arthrobacter sp. Leaf69]KQN95276.1 thiosulfate sulfurtransferase [Arthrobacter sp. Leaf69]
MKTLMDVVTLKDRLDAAGTAGPRTVLLDVRWALGDPHGREHYLAEHLPGAVFVDLATELAGPADPSRGRHPLPTLEQFQASARAWGIRGGDVVVTYDDSGNLAAARLWWMLRNAGFPKVYLLDGGLAAWRGEGFDVESGERQAEPGDVELTDDALTGAALTGDALTGGALTGGALPVIDAGQAAAWGRRGLLLDARAGERYRGEFEPVDPRAGHIPGAVSAPTTANVGVDGRFLSPEALRERFTSLGVRADVPTAVYCGSGVTAAHEIAALEIAGFPAALYPGSFSEWSNNDANEVVTGAAPYPDGAGAATDPDEAAAP